MKLNQKEARAANAYVTTGKAPAPYDTIKIRSLEDIITSYEESLELYVKTEVNEHKYQLEVILTLAKEIQTLKNYVRTHEEDL